MTNADVPDEVRIGWTQLSWPFAVTLGELSARTELERAEGWLVCSLPDLPELRHHITVGDGEDANSWASLTMSEPLARPERASADGVTVLIYTSGTTADPKGVQHSHQSVAAELALGVGDYITP